MSNPSRAGVGAGEELALGAAQPAEEWASLLQVLGQRGVVAKLTAQGEGRVATAKVPANQQSAVADALQVDGIALAPSGQPNLRFKKSP